MMEPYKEGKKRPHNARDCATLLDGSTTWGKRVLTDKAKELIEA